MTSIIALSVLQLYQTCSDLFDIDSTQVIGTSIAPYGRAIAANPDVEVLIGLDYYGIDDYCKYLKYQDQWFYVDPMNRNSMYAVVDNGPLIDCLIDQYLVRQ